MSKLHVSQLIALIMVLSMPAAARAQPPSTLGSALASDFKYIANNGADDVIDVATAPLHIGEAVPLLTSPRFYLVLGGAGALGAVHTRSIRR